MNIARQAVAHAPLVTTTTCLPATPAVSGCRPPVFMPVFSCTLLLCAYCFTCSNVAKQFCTFTVLSNPLGLSYTPQVRASWLHMLSVVFISDVHHHHHQITKLSHSINAIGPAPHRSGRKRYLMLML
jgi:hypothetical protein